MDQRIALQANTLLRFQNKEGGAVQYTIVKEISRGGSCIVYDAFYTANTGDVKHVRIKECYPSKLRITRQSHGSLVVDSRDAVEFEEIKEKFKSRFSLGNGLFYAEGLFDALTNTIDIYTSNQTTYLVSTYSPEHTLATYRPANLKLAVTLTKQVAHILKRIHNEGYVYLDIKPENVLVSDSYVTRVQLFDFDSLIPMSLVHGKATEDLGNLRLSYSKGFAAIELQTGKLRRLGPHTDVYGIGALLFYLLFGITPTASDGESYAKYDFGKMVYASEHQDKLFVALADFFHNALANFFRDRYHDMQQVIDVLTDIEKLADTAATHIHSTRVAGPAIIVGRDAEIQQLKSWVDSEKQDCLYVTGMGGIGKSTIVRAFLSQYRACFDNLLYLQFDQTLLQTLTDDFYAKISTISKDANETVEEYFKRKLCAFRSIVHDTRSILVIDNFTGHEEQSLLDILSVGWKVLLITRNVPTDTDHPVLSINAIDDKAALHHLVETNLGRSLTEEELPHIDRIIEKVGSHTLIIDLLSKQISNSYLDIAQAAILVAEFGFSNIAPEKVSYQKDQVTGTATIAKIIQAVFSTKSLADSSRSVLKAMSLLGSAGIDIGLLQALFELKTKDIITELISNGWLQADARTVYMHPVIQETLHSIPWTQGAYGFAECFLRNLAGRIKVESRQDTLFKSQVQPIKNSVLDKWFDRFSDNAPTVGGNANNTPISYETVEQYVAIAQMVISNCKNDESLEGSDHYWDLLYCTVINAPRQKEEFILWGVKALLDRQSGANSIAVMNLYNKMLSIYHERRNFNAAEEVIAESVVASKKLGSNYVQALYYDMLSEHCDHMLGGAYDVDSREAIALRRKMCMAMDKAIHYAKRSTLPKSKQLLVRNLLAKATLLIRSDPKRQKKILGLLGAAQEILAREEHPYSDNRCVYHMVYAWYYTFVSPNFDEMVGHIEKAREIAEITIPTELDLIDNMVVPCADIFCNWEEYDLAARLLMDAIERCKKNASVNPYVRKVGELYRYLLDVCCEWQRFDLAKEALKQIDHYNKLDIAMNYQIDVQDDVREFLLNHQG